MDAVRDEINAEAPLPVSAPLWNALTLSSSVKNTFKINFIAFYISVYIAIVAA